ncbi:MAG: RluA family pseudouridine synthase [Bacteroidetes bacterium]|nr:RluA family pseudouridine synthase [Bacteroidota bacterium]
MPLSDHPPLEDHYEETGESVEFYEHYRFVADSGQNPLRIDKFIVNRIVGVSRSKIQAAVEAGNIMVDNNPVKSNHKVKPGEVITIVMSHPKWDVEIIPQDIPINILFEDDHLIVLNKEAGMVVHPAYGNFDGTLVNALAFHLRKHPMFQTGDIRPGLVHRIDKDTSGIMVAAKTEYALNHLSRQFFERTTERTYQALVWGSFSEKTGTVTGNIGRDIRDRKKMAVFPEGDQGKHAVTHYTVLEEFGYTSLLECRLETGRTHQIRVHLAHIAHPVFNDATYGGDQILKGTTFTKYRQFVRNCFSILPRQALHAKSLGFRHPVEGSRLFFDSVLPDDMAQAVDKWRKYVSGKEDVE